MLLKNADLVTVLLDSTVNFLKKSTNIDFEQESYFVIRDLVATVVYSHLNVVTTLDVDTHTHYEHQEEELAWRTRRAAKTNQMKITASSSTAAKTRKADLCASRVNLRGRVAY